MRNEVVEEKVRNLEKRIERFQKGIKELAKMAEWDLSEIPDMCICEGADYAVGLHGYRCIHHQLIEWAAVMDIEEHDAEAML